MLALSVCRSPDGWGMAVGSSPAGALGPAHATTRTNSHVAAESLDRVIVALMSLESPMANYILPLGTLGRASLAVAGGKAANLGELIEAGFPVPDGFCITTGAYALAAAAAHLSQVVEELEVVQRDDLGRREFTLGRSEGLARRAREALLEVPVPKDVAEAISAAYRALGEDGPRVAVRSSATAEDLPMASFAGQQETYLNIAGEAAVLDAVQRCWASLWTDRAVAYRGNYGIDHRSVRLAVVVQRMVAAAVAGVLFTANPLTGRRRQAVIDAAPGLGEAVVSGAVNPDHFVVSSSTGEVLDRPDRADACLAPEQARALAALGGRVEQRFGVPQDIEWAIDPAGRIWILQARPITTLFPLPPEAPAMDGQLRVYFSVNVAQGVFRPLTPMGIQLFRLLGSAAAGLFGRPPADPVAGPGFMVEAGQRLFFDITPLLRTRLGGRFVLFLTSLAEARSSAALRHLLADPRLNRIPAPPWRVASWALPVLLRTRLPLGVASALARPAAARQRAAVAAAEVLAFGEIPPLASAGERLEAVERLFRQGVPRLVPVLIPNLMAGLGALALANRLLGDLATADERDAVRRALPHNPTTEMDLALWALAQRMRTDAVVVRALREEPLERLAEAYHAGTLPGPLQTGLITFLASYGHRGVAEIDVGLPRWSEDPAHIIASSQTTCGSRTPLWGQTPSSLAPHKRPTRWLPNSLAGQPLRAGGGACWCGSCCGGLVRWQANGRPRSSTW